MIDRLKIRVWDKEEERYWKKNEIKANLEWLMFPEEYKEENYPPDYVEVEQCTGLKDKNDKLVYEGDLLRYCSMEGYIQAELFVVKDLRSFFFLLDREDPYYAVDWIEVVGNIHINENEELLK